MIDLTQTTALTTITDILLYLGDLVWLGYLAALVMYFGLLLANVALNSSFITMATICTVVWVTDHYRDFLLALPDDTAQLLVRFAWYIGFALSEMLMMYIIYKVHVVFKQTYSTLTKVMLLSCFVLAFIHLSRFAERHLFYTDFLQPIYRWGIPSINVSTAVMAVTLGLFAVYQHLRRKKQGGLL
jgi:hypothetical protein